MTTCYLDLPYADNISGTPPGANGDVPKFLQRIFRKELGKGVQNKKCLGAGVEALSRAAFTLHSKFGPGSFEDLATGGI